MGGAFPQRLCAVKRRGPRCNWWEASARRQSSSYVCLVNNNGNANNNVATHGGIYVPL